MRNENIPIKENIDIPFENDENVVGKWETVGEYDTKVEFYSDLFGSVGSESAQNIYFLPNGERYWCYGWTKGKLLIDYGDSTVVSDYTIEEHNGVRYMFVNSKSYNYHQNGRVTVLVLRQVNTVRYSAKELARKDNICKPFVNDPHVLGKWRAHDFCKSKEAFFPNEPKNDNWYFSNIEFKPFGEVISCYDYGNEIISGRDMQEWTNGYLLRKWNSCACEYEIKIIDGREYLFIEWKSGNYRYGGFDTDYYVFVRA